MFLHRPHPATNNAIDSQLDAAMWAAGRACSRSTTCLSRSIPLPRQHNRRRPTRTTQLCATYSNGGKTAEGASSNPGPSNRGLTEVFGKLLTLPWERALSWGVVVLLAMQLKDFFGV